MGTTCDMPLCGTCGSDWAAGAWTEGCAECGGGAMTRSCPVCGGACDAVFQRDIPGTHADEAACWQGRCRREDAPLKHRS